MRTRLLAIAALLALAPGCADEPVPMSDPGHRPSPTGSATTSPAPEPPADIGPAFRAFARGGEPPPMAEEVQLYLGNAFTGVVTADDDRDAWATCTEIGSYAGRSCPLSPLTVLRQHDAVTYTAKPRGSCMPTYGPLPPDLRELDRTVVVPPLTSVDACAQRFAVQLLTDDGGRLVAVSTLLGEP
ncbi:hypothetical protein [Nocardioides pyridinolyticus]